MSKEIGLDFIRKDGKKKIMVYRDCRYDDQGWADVKSFYPMRFDLCHIKIKNNQKNKVGWWTGKKWTGLRLDPTDIITHWKLTGSIY